MHRLTKRLDFNFKDTNTIFSLISEIDKLNTIFSLDTKLSPQTTKRLMQSIIITSSGASNRIEGNRLTNEEIEALYKKINIKNFKTRDQQKVAGYVEVLEMIFESFEGMNFNEGLILQLHEMMLKYTPEATRYRGVCKIGPNRVEARDKEGKFVKVIFNPTEPGLTPIEMHDLLERTQKSFEEKELHPLLIIGNFLFEFLAIHPFQDGNGRISRLLTNLLLLQQGFNFMSYVSHESLVEKRKVDYYISLGKAQQTRKTEKENIFSRMEFFLQILKEQANQAIMLADGKDIRMFLTDKQLVVRDHISEHYPCSRKEIVEATGLAEGTVKQIINKLIDMKKIIRRGEGRGVRYEIV